MIDSVVTFLSQLYQFCFSIVFAWLIYYCAVCTQIGSLGIFFKCLLLLSHKCWDVCLCTCLCVCMAQQIAIIAHKIWWNTIQGNGSGLLLKQFCFPFCIENEWGINKWDHKKGTRVNDYVITIISWQRLRCLVAVIIIKALNSFIFDTMNVESYQRLNFKMLVIFYQNS